MNTALTPSVTALPPVTVIAGVAGGGVADGSTMVKVVPPIAPPSADCQLEPAMGCHSSGRFADPAGREVQVTVTDAGGLPGLVMSRVRPDQPLRLSAPPDTCGRPRPCQLDGTVMVTEPLLTAPS